MRKSCALILLFCILNLTFSSCGTSRLTSLEEAKEQTIDNNYLILHTPVEKYKLTDYVFEEDRLKGNVERISKYRGFNIHVYTRYLSIRNIDKNSGMYLEIEKSKIKKIIYKKERLGLKILAVTGGIFGAIVVFSAIDFYTNGFDLH